MSKCKISNKHRGGEKDGTATFDAEEKLSTPEGTRNAPKRAELRARLKKGTITLREVLESADDEVIAKMRVSYLIQSLSPSWQSHFEEDRDEIDQREPQGQGLGKRQIDELLKKLG